MPQKHGRWKVDIQRLESFEMWIWRRLMKISWTEHRSNQEVLDMVDENRSWMNTIWHGQNNWHVLRSESLLCTVLSRMERTRTRGRQSDTMIDWMKSNDVEYKHIKKRAYDREDWRHWRSGPAWKGRALNTERLQRILLKSGVIIGVEPAYYVEREVA